MRSIDYYFTINSPWTYFGHGLLHEIAARRGARIVYKPMPMREVFAATGSLPLPERPPARQRYRWMELQRWRDKRELPLNPKPAHFPLDPTLANKAIVAVLQLGGQPGDLITRMLAGVWTADMNLNDADVIADIIRAAGFDSTRVLETAASAEIAMVYAGNGNDAIAADVFGAPGYVLDGEVFWGQDRLELLDDALASGRIAYHPL